MTKKWLLAICTVLLLLVVIPSYRSHLFFLNFVDEDDNLVIGSFVARGEKLYTDVYTQHQPLMFVMSAAWQKLTKPNTLQMVVTRHRQFVMVWSAAWLILLTARFGWPLFLTGAVLELTDIMLLGNLFLAESVVVGPLLYVVAYLQQAHRAERRRAELPVVVGLLWCLVYSLAPLWPLLAVLFLLLIGTARRKREVILAITLEGLLVTALLLPFVGIRAYWLDAIYINYHYYLPLTTGIGLGTSLLKAFLAPVFALLAGGSGQLLLLLKVLSLSYLFELFWAVRDKKYRQAGISFLLLGLCSLRYIEPGNTLYGAFHMLPWFALLILMVAYGFAESGWKTRTRSLISLALLICLGWTTLTLAKTNVFDHRDPSNDYYIHYSPSDDIRNVVSILSDGVRQTVWVEPVMYWPYWETGAKQYSPMVNYYGWMDKTPPLKNELEAELSQELPTLVWSEGPSLGLGMRLDEYVAIMRDGKATNLYLRKDKVKEVTPIMQQKLSYYRYAIP